MPTTMRRTPALHARAAAALFDGVGLAHAASPTLLARLGDTSTARAVTLEVDDATVTGDVNALRGEADLRVLRADGSRCDLRVRFVAENIDDGLADPGAEPSDDEEREGFLADDQPPFSVVRLEYVDRTV